MNAPHDGSQAASAWMAEHFDRAQRLSDTGSWEWDIATGNIVWSRQIFRIFGLKPNAFIPSYPAFLERIHPDDREDVKRAVQRAVEGREHYDLEHRIVRLDGTVRTVREQGVVRRGTDGEPVAMLGAVQDVTGLRAAEAASRRSQEMLSSMLRISPEAIVVTDPAARILAFSAGAESMFGYLAEEVIGLNVDRLIPPRLRRNHQGHVEGFAARPCRSLRMHERAEILGLRKNGEEFPAEASLAKLETLDGFAFTTIIRDLSERKATERRLIEAREAAEQAVHAKSSFLANMSHEIRTPLNGVLGVAGALARTELSAKQWEMVHLIETSGRALEGLLSDILDLAKADAGRMSLRAEPFDLNAVICSTFALFRASAAKKAIGFRMSIADEVRDHFLGDDLRIRQVLSNLLSNAVKFTEEGEIRLSVSQVHAEPDTCRVRFVVEDTGIGFPPELAETLFERFEQADGSITRQFGGTGLGLAISKALVALMGGTISATAAPARGATFMFELPLRKASNAAAAAPLRRPTPPPPMQPLKILLAEDHPINRLAVQFILDAIPVDLTCVENGHEAVEAAETAGFDLVLMDMQMPVMDGLTAIRRIREREAATGRSRTWICVVTANALDEHRAAATAAGADAFLTKPLDASALISMVVEIAGAAGLAGAAVSA
ncbi:PAS domain S-box protein [Phenylobacterium sp. LH3H17]|uniref:PAS domain-containing hybrid sensor histidine kinase/response regulator n=1 Tax=Phenylobacterium sp. LH3H17 TaxID=2903901 RepID=UPI0020C98912|nr:ATP-binding protein [Phenylobacterium sp. LH3H17]UTP38316.1 PAS domain S-box protein [Phenylobacterium sp. LH3H17]